MFTLVRRVKGPAITLGFVDAAVCALGEAVLFNDQLPYGKAVELGGRGADGKGDRAAVGGIVQLLAIADNAGKLAGSFQGKLGLGNNIKGFIDIRRPLGHCAARCGFHRNRGIHRGILGVNRHKSASIASVVRHKVAALDECRYGQRVACSREQTAVDFANLGYHFALEQTAVDGNRCHAVGIPDHVFKAAAVDDDICTHAVDLHRAACTALKGAAVDGKGIHRVNGHAVFKGTAVNGDLAVRSFHGTGVLIHDSGILIHGNGSLKVAVRDDSPGCAGHLAVEGAAGNSARVGHGVPVIVVRADLCIQQSGFFSDLYVPLDVIIVAVKPVIVEPEGAVYQGECLSVLVVGPAAFAAAEVIADGLAVVIVWKDIGDIVVFLCQCCGAGGVGRGALGKGGQRHC